MQKQNRNTDASTELTSHTHQDGWTITPRALTTIATILTILYSLQAPVRYVIAVVSSVDALERRVTTLEGIVAHDIEPAPPRGAAISSAPLAAPRTGATRRPDPLPSR